MLTLGIETTGKRASVALLDGRTVLAHCRLIDRGRPDTKTLPVCVQQMLRQQDIKADELDCLAVSRGPGSFTGLRVGLVFAKTFSYTTLVPLVPVDTFAATAGQLDPSEDVPQSAVIEVVEDLRKGQIAWQRFSYCSNEWNPEAGIEVSEIEAWASLPRENVLLSGPTIDRILKQLPESGGVSSAGIIPEQKRSPDASVVALLGQNEFRKNGPVHPFELQPLYIRRSAAEERKAGK